MEICLAHTWGPESIIFLPKSIRGTVKLVVWKPFNAPMIGALHSLLLFNHDFFVKFYKPEKYRLSVDVVSRNITLFVIVSIHN